MYVCRASDTTDDTRDNTQWNTQKNTPILVSIPMLRIECGSDYGINWTIQATMIGLTSIPSIDSKNL